MSSNQTMTEQDISTEIFALTKSEDFQKPLSIVVVGASGHLARTQVVPAIFSLFCKKLLPEKFHLVGYARSQMDDSSFRGDTLEDGLKGHESHVKGEHAMTQMQEDEESSFKHLLSMIGVGKTAPYEVTESDRTLRKNFLRQCHYVHGSYDKPESFEKLAKQLEELENASESGKSGTQSHDVGANRIFYLAIPPPQFESTLSLLSSKVRGNTGWSRVIIEKPFGEDLESAKKLNQTVANKFEEKDVYRIDHFMGKETLLNVIPLRFSNLLYSNVWNRDCIESIIVNVKESFGLEGRAGYFEESGIMRDMIQNHLLSMVALLTMEEPTFNNETAIMKAKTELFQSMKPISSEDAVFGQYVASEDKKKAGYLDEPGVKQNSKTPTFVSMIVHIENDRWRGVPILMHCGKALNETKSEMIITFKHSEKSSLYSQCPQNQLIIRSSPNPSIIQRVNTKQPGLASAAAPTELVLAKQTQTQLTAVPAPYERLVFDVLRGNHQLFVSAAETEAAWKVVDQVAKSFESSGSQPVRYQFGSNGPTEAQALMAKYHLSTSLADL